MNATSLTNELKATAQQLGFSLAAACPAVSPAGAAKLGEWLQLGYGGGMDYISVRQPAYADPGMVLEGARSILMLTMNYRTAEPELPRDGQGRISRYAWGPA